MPLAHRQDAFLHQRKQVTRHRGVSRLGIETKLPDDSSLRQDAIFGPRDLQARLFDLCAKAHFRPRLGFQPQPPRKGVRGIVRLAKSVELPRDVISARASYRVIGSRKRPGAKNRPNLY